MHLTLTDTELKHLDWFQGFSQDTSKQGKKISSVILA